MRCREGVLGHAVCDEKGGSVSHVDRLFGFWTEKRRECLQCKAKSVTYEAGWMWRVNAVGLDGAEATVQELYLRSCAEVEFDDFCSSCKRSVPHRGQQRLATLPNVLLVHVDRGASGGTADMGGAVLAEDHLAFPDLGPNLELASVLFSSCLLYTSPSPRD